MPDRCIVKQVHTCFRLKKLYTGDRPCDLGLTPSPPSYTGIPYGNHVLVASFPIQYPAEGLGKAAEHDPRDKVPATHMGDFEHAPGFWLWSGTA